MTAASGHVVLHAAQEVGCGCHAVYEHAKNGKNSRCIDLPMKSRRSTQLFPELIRSQEPRDVRHPEGQPLVILECKQSDAASDAVLLMLACDVACCCIRSKQAFEFAHTQATNLSRTSRHCTGDIKHFVCRWHKPYCRSDLRLSGGVIACCGPLQRKLRKPLFLLAWAFSLPCVDKSFDLSVCCK